MLKSIFSRPPRAVTVAHQPVLRHRMVIRPEHDGLPTPLGRLSWRHFGKLLTVDTYESGMQEWRITPLTSEVKKDA